MAKSPTNHDHATRRVAEKAKRQAQAQKAAAFNQLLAKLSPAEVHRLRVQALTNANARSPAATPEEVVRDAQEEFEASVRFLIGSA